MTPYALMLQTDPDDEFFTRSSLEEMGLSEMFHFSTAGDIGLTIESRGTPVVILLNDSTASPALELLRKIKAGSYNHIPVVILGEIVASEHKDAFYIAGASAFISKPFTVADTRKKIETFTRYWFEVVDGDHE